MPVPRGQAARNVATFASGHSVCQLRRLDAHVASWQPLLAARSSTSDALSENLSRAWRLERCPRPARELKAGNLRFCACWQMFVILEGMGWQREPGDNEGIVTLLRSRPKERLVVQAIRMFCLRPSVPSPLARQCFHRFCSCPSSI